MSQTDLPRDFASLRTLIVERGSDLPKRLKAVATYALENPDELRKLLATDAEETANSGFMDRFKDLGNSVLDTTTGSLETLEQSLQARVERNDDRQAQMEDRLVSTEARIRAQYQALDTSMARLNALSNYVTQQMAALSNNS